MDKLKAFETFASVATRGSLSAAARAEGVAPAVVSRRLDALEEHLGVKLLVRTTRRIALTHEGTAFLDDCQRLLADVAGAEASVSAGGVQASGHLRLTAPAGFGRRHVAPLVPAFHAEHPRLRISLNLSDRVVELAAEGYDCAVRVGDLLSFYAKIERVGTTSVTVEVQVLAQRLATQNAYVQVAHAILTYVAIDDEGRPRPVAPAASRASAVQAPALQV